jgi:citrate lyase subunit beta / citryl-CoA lyase
MSVYRTFLFAPGNHARRVEKALSLDADAVILDLEDAVAIAEKKATRSKAVTALQGPRTGLGYIRVNAISTEFCHGDIQAVVAKGVDGIILPKVEAAHELKTIDWLIAELERERGLSKGGIDLIPIIETAKGMQAAFEIASAGTRARRMAFGAGDLTLDMNIEWSRGELELLPYRSAVVQASRAAGIEPPIDTVWVDLKDGEGLKASAVRCRQLGYQGKMCIYPDQVLVVNDVFTPGPAAVAQARKMVAAFEEAEKAGLASIQVDGKFIDYPIVYRAQSILATVAKIEGMKARG